MIHIKNLSKSFNKGIAKVNILRDINFSIDDGEILCIMGPSGCGKSTLLGIIGGLDPPTTGNVVFNNINLYELSNRDLNTFRNQNIGMIFQNHNLLNELTCYENICLPLLFSRNIKQDNYNHVENTMRRLGLDKKSNLFSHQLSGGEQQRTSITRALIRNPRLLLADEPTGNLDQKNAKNIMNIFHEVIKDDKMSIVIVTHDADIAKQCHRIINMLDGRLLE